MAFTAQGQPNVSVFVSSLGGYEEPCQKTVRQFRDKGIKINVVSMTHELVQSRTAEGFSELPVVKLEREDESWQAHQADRIAAYAPKLAECDLRFNAARGPKLGVWRR